MSFQRITTINIVLTNATLVVPSDEMFLTRLTLIRSYFCMSSFVSVEVFLFMTHSRTESTFLLHRLQSLSLFGPSPVIYLSPSLHKSFVVRLSELYGNFWMCACKWMMGCRLIGGHVRFDTAEIASRTRLTDFRAPQKGVYKAHKIKPERVQQIQGL
jgi:hypothetical protein